MDHQQEELEDLCYQSNSSDNVSSPSISTLPQGTLLSQQEIQVCTVVYLKPLLFTYSCHGQVMKQLTHISNIILVNRICNIFFIYSNTILM